MVTQEVPEATSEDKAEAYDTVANRALTQLRQVAEENPPLTDETKTAYVGQAIAIAAAIREKKAEFHNEFEYLIGKPNPIQAESRAGLIGDMEHQTEQALEEEAEYIEEQFRQPE